MHQITSQKKYAILASLPILFFAFVGMSWHDFFEKKTIEEPKELTIDLSEITMCAPIGRFKISMEDITKATRPMAPKLFPKWQTKMQITSNSTEAKQFFNQGLFYLYAFNHAEADRFF